MLALALALFLVPASLLAQNAGRPQATVPKNASRIVATVLSQKVWPPGSLENVRPLVPSDRAYSSLTVRVTASEFVSPDVDHLAGADRTIELFTLDSLPTDFAGKSIQATIRLIGDADHSRWMLETLSSVQ